jgi:peptidoglycan hydrolase-like amidase
VDDPYDTISPYHDWGPIVFTAEDLASKLGLPGTPTGFRVVETASGRVDALVAIGPGWTKDVPGPTVRTRLGLRSTWFSVKKQRNLRSALARRAA